MWLSPYSRGGKFQTNIFDSSTNRQLDYDSYINRQLDYDNSTNRQPDYDNSTNDSSSILVQRRTLPTWQWRHHLWRVCFRRGSDFKRISDRRASGLRLRRRQSQAGFSIQLNRSRQQTGWSQKCASHETSRSAKTNLKICLGRFQDCGWGGSKTYSILHKKACYIIPTYTLAFHHPCPLKPDLLSDSKMIG